MLFAVDVGNTNIVAGVFDGDRILFSERISTDISKTDLEYVVTFKAVMDVHNTDISLIDSAVVSSVVPPVNSTIITAVKKLFGTDPVVVSPGVKTGLNIAIDNPASVGSDLIVDAVASVTDYGAPVVFIDMGTATTVSFVDENKNYLGGLILPGVRVSLDSLVNRTSQLPRISLEAPRKVVGRNTVDCMKGGIVLGQASMIDGLIDRIFEEIGFECTVVATGGLVSSIVPHCRKKIIMDNDLTLRGLKYIYDKNSDRN